MSTETVTFTQQESDSAHLSDILAEQTPVDRPSTPDIPVGGYLRHYEIIRPLGAGGMASVLLARDTKLGRLVAIKFLRNGTNKGRDLLAEAQATARARHENIVVIYEVGSIDSRPYMVLEYLDGRTLREVMNNRSRGDGRALPRGLSLEIIASVVRALGAAHRSGIVHLDLKPENIVMVDSGQVKVLDFGIASFMEQERRIRAGTRAYMSPEQWRGEELDGRSDLWAAGIILHELLTGVHPLAPISTERLASVRELEMAMPNIMDSRPELVGLAGIVARCLRKRREERYASADELLEALEPWVARSKRGRLWGK